MKYQSAFLMTFLLASSSFAGDCKYTTHAIAGDGSGKGNFYDEKSIYSTQTDLNGCLDSARAMLGTSKDFKANLLGATVRSETRKISLVKVFYGDESIRINASVVAKATFYGDVK